MSAIQKDSYKNRNTNHQMTITGETTIGFATRMTSEWRNQLNNGSSNATTKQANKHFKTFILSELSFCFHTIDIDAEHQSTTHSKFGNSSTRWSKQRHRRRRREPYNSMIDNELWLKFGGLYITVPITACLNLRQHLYFFGFFCIFFLYFFTKDKSNRVSFFSFRFYYQLKQHRYAHAMSSIRFRKVYRKTLVLSPNECFFKNKTNLNEIGNKYRWCNTLFEYKMRNFK